MNNEQNHGSSGTEHDGGTAVVTRTRTAQPKRRQLPPWKVLLHNDDVSEMGYVVNTIVELTPLNEHAAMVTTLEAHQTGVALLFATHREHAELVQEQFTSKKMTVTIEPDD